MSEGISMKAFGDIIGVSGNAVKKAIDSGRIPMRYVSRRNGKGSYLIKDVKGAREAWGENTNHTKSHQAGMPRADTVPDPYDRETKADIPKSNTALTSGKARAVRETYQAKLAQLDYEEKSGKLISADKVKMAQFTQGQILREAIMNIPDRVTSSLAAELGKDVPAHVVHAILEKELRNILIEVAKHGRTANG